MRRFTGHMNIGPITAYGANAMHWGVNIRTKRWGWVCFRLPFRCFGCWWPLYFYVSPNATPWAATFYLGKEVREEGKARIRRRRQELGHNFAVNEPSIYARLLRINGHSEKSIECALTGRGEPDE